jgi:NAD(P)-dependent dehydrogenase (short-subunit alcohol dehydrogenase family)
MSGRPRRARRKLDGAVVVITGASSGLGRATAHRFAAEGAGVVVAARRPDPLRKLESDLGSRALAVPTDVTDETAVRELSGRAADRFGGIDVWVNNAAVTACGRFEEIPHEAYRRVLETNVLGYVYGAWAALPHLHARRGTLINVGPGNSRVPAPFINPYEASKFADKGFTASLRQELRSSGVRVAAVLPTSIDTPLFQHAGNWCGRVTRPLRPVNDPDRVARAIVRCARRPGRERLVGRGARPMVAMHSIGGALFERVFAIQIEHDNFLDEPAAPTMGNLFAPVGDGGGGQRRLARAPSPAPSAGGAIPPLPPGGPGLVTSTWQ